MVIVFAFLLTFTNFCEAQTSYREPFVGWTFDVVISPQYWYGTSIGSNFGYYPTAMLYADGKFGSSQFATVTTNNYAQMMKMDWVGTTLGDPRPAPYAIEGYCLGFKHPNSNYRSFVMAFPTTYYKNLALKFAAVRSQTGFKQMDFAWSVDGSTYNAFDARLTPEDAFTLTEIDMSSIPAIENQPIVYLRVTISNILSTAYQGNIKLDNLCIYGDKCANTMTYYDSIPLGDAYHRYGFDCPAFTQEGDFFYERHIHFDSECDSIYYLYLNVTDTTPETPIIPVDTTETDTTAIDTTGIINFSAPISLNVFPNPFSDYLTIENIDNESIVIYNELGQIVYEINATTTSSLYSSKGKTYTLPTSKWKPGVYFIHNRQSNTLKKVVKY
ncbi:MAG: T9SS type A sorting domain-containing protein [Bacteroidales bacterium]|nr:T9SS type A sorting domain-containing protein [Bacteroidales bacterium]